MAFEQKPRYAMKNLLVLLLLLLSLPAFSQTDRFRLVPKPAEKKVEVQVDGKLFTAYCYTDSLPQPRLFPLIVANGSDLTQNLPGGGIFWGFGDANGLDFWQYPQPAIDPKKAGAIHHVRILQMKNGMEGCGLEVAAEWRKPDGSTLLLQNTRYIFKGSGNTRTVDVVFTLSALEETVKMTDHADGLLALALRQDIPGQLLSSETFENNAITGTQARWVKWSSKINNELVNVVLLDHPDNIRSPAYWQVKSPGFLAVNPWGIRAYTQGKDFLDIQLPPLTSVIYRYRLLITTRSGLNRTQIEAEYEKFSRLK
jgi:Methane oxygenase PmoA